MNRIVEIDHQRWAGSSPAELGYGGLEDKTTVQTYTHDDGSTHDVLVIDGRKDGKGPTILKSASLNLRINPFLIRQETIVATKLGARVAVAELPGVSGIPLDSAGNFDRSIDIDEKLETVRQTRKEFRQVARGHLDLVAQKQLASLIDTLGLSANDVVELHGHSLAAMLVAAMGRVAAKEQSLIPLRIQRIHLEDPLNIFDLSTIVFLQKFNNLRNETNRRNAIYLEENVAIGHGDVTAFERQSDETGAIDKYIKSKQRSTVLNSAQALRKGIAPIIHDAVNAGIRSGVIDSETIISTTHFKDSLVADNSDMQQLSEQVDALGVRSESYEYIPLHGDPTELGHLTGVSLGRAASIALLTPLNET